MVDFLHASPLAALTGDLQQLALGHSVRLVAPLPRGEEGRLPPAGFPRRTVFTSFCVWRPEVMLKLDSNGDGKISYEEFLTVMRVGEYSKKGKEGALASLEVVLPSKLNEMVNGLQRLVSKLGLAAIQYASQ